MVTSDADLSLRDLITQVVVEVLDERLPELQAPVPLRGRFDDHVRFTTSEAVEYSRKSVSLLRHALASGELHGSQAVVGGKWSIRRCCLDAWLDGRSCRQEHIRSAS